LLNNFCRDILKSEKGLNNPKLVILLSFLTDDLKSRIPNNLFVLSIAKYLNTIMQQYKDTPLYTNLYNSRLESNSNNGNTASKNKINQKIIEDIKYKKRFSLILTAEEYTKL